MCTVRKKLNKLVSNTKGFNVILALLFTFFYLCNVLNIRTMRIPVTQTEQDYNLLNRHTGEVLEWKRTKIVNVDEFIMFFFASIPELFQLEGLHLKVLMCCWKASSYNSVDAEGNIVNNNKLLKDYIRQHGLDISDNTIDVIISKLAKKGILIKKCRGSYMLNPRYFFKGRLAEKSKLELKMVTV